MYADCADRAQRNRSDRDTGRFGRHSDCDCLLHHLVGAVFIVECEAELSVDAPFAFGEHVDVGDTIAGPDCFGGGLNRFPACGVQLWDRNGATRTVCHASLFEGKKPKSPAQATYAGDNDRGFTWVGDLNADLVPSCSERTLSAINVWLENRQRSFALCLDESVLVPSSECCPNGSHRRNGRGSKRRGLCVEFHLSTFVRLVCTSNDACNRDVRKARVACATAAGSGALLADDNTDRGAGDLRAAPTSTTPCWTWARGGFVRHVPLFRGGGS